MEFRKNDLVTLEIEDCGIDGEGIGKADGFTFCQGRSNRGYSNSEDIKAKKNYGYGRLMEVVKPSPYRLSRNVHLPVSVADASFRHFHMISNWNLRQIK